MATAPDRPTVLPPSDPAPVSPNDTAGPEPAWRRLSPRMLLIHPITELVRALPALAGFLVAGLSSGGHGAVWTLVGVAIVMGLSLSRWFTTRLRITATRIELRHGLLRRATVSAPRDRVRTVDLTAHPLHRALGLARVAVGTGMSDRHHGGRVVIDGLTRAEAQRLQVELLRGRGPIDVGEPVPAGNGIDSRPTGDHRYGAAADQTLLSLEPRWIRYAPFTLSGAVALAAVLTFGWRLLSESGGDREKVAIASEATHALRHADVLAAVAIGALAVIAVLTLASLAGYAFLFWRFQLVRTADGTLRVTRGLVTTRVTSIERRRLAGVEISEPLLLRVVRGARVIAIATGLRVGRGAEHGGELLVPPAPRAVAASVSDAVLASADAVHVGLRRHGRRALARRLTRAVLPAAAVVLGTALGWAAAGWGAGWLGFVVLVPLAAALGADRYRSLGHAVSVGAAPLAGPRSSAVPYLVVRRGSLIRRRYHLSASAIIGWNTRTSWFQRRAGLVTLTATTAAGRQGYPVQDLPASAAIELATTLTPTLLAEFLDLPPVSSRCR